MHMRFGQILHLILLACFSVSFPGSVVLHAKEHSSRPMAYPEPHFSTNEVDLFYDMNAFSALEELVGRAQKSIKLDFYIFGGPTAERVIDVMIQKLQAGVSVQVLLDHRLGTLKKHRNQTLPAYRRMMKSGIPVRFHSHTLIRPQKYGRTVDHNKYVVIDSEEALLGSMNIAFAFYKFHDLFAHVRGPVAGDLIEQFDYDWVLAAQREMQKFIPPTTLGTDKPALFSDPNGPGSVRLLQTAINNRTIRDSLVRLLGQARKSLYIEMQEFNDPRILKQILAAQKRGIDIRILLDPNLVSDLIPWINWAPQLALNARLVKNLLRAGIPVRLYQPNPDFNVLHTKLAIIDGDVLFVGSANWTHGGFERVYESVLEIHGGRSPRQAEDMFINDWNHHSVNAREPRWDSLLLNWLYLVFAGWS